MRKLDLPKFEHEGEYRKKLDLVKRKFKKEDLDYLSKAFMNLKNEKKLIEVSLSEVNTSLEALQEEIFSRLMDENLEKIKTQDGTTLFAQVTPYPSVKDRPAFFAWVKKNKAEHLLTYSHQGLKSLALSIEEEGGKQPDGVVVFKKETIGYRSAKG